MIKGFREYGYNTEIKNIKEVVFEDFKVREEDREGVNILFAVYRHPPY